MDFLQETISIIEQNSPIEILYEKRALDVNVFIDRALHFTYLSYVHCKAVRPLADEIYMYFLRHGFIQEIIIENHTNIFS